jgi:hypothetical protein
MIRRMTMALSKEEQYGFFLLARICAGTLFMAVANNEAPLGLLLFRVKRAVPVIRAALEN